MRQMNQRSSLCWWQESLLKLKTGILNQFKARHQRHIVIRYEAVEMVRFKLAANHYKTGTARRTEHVVPVAQGHLSW